MRKNLLYLQLQQIKFTSNKTDNKLSDYSTSSSISIQIT